MEHRKGGRTTIVDIEIVDDFEDEIWSGAEGANQGEVDVEVEPEVGLSDEVGPELVVRAEMGLDYGGTSQSGDSESDDGLYFESDDSDGDDIEIDLLSWMCDEHILSRDEEGMHEVGMVREATFSIEVEQEDMNEDENDEDLEEHEDLSPPNSRDEEGKKGRPRKHPRPAMVEGTSTRQGDTRMQESASQEPP
ncbi:hypothetical protein NL676_009305 [Syzygium grande]|nr:hypothetical protein NL676_009305 [Syzygium grande]